MSTPRINLRRATSYTHDRGPLSSTSSRFSFNHLLFTSPPPSPGLPQLLPRPRRSATIARPSRLVRALLICSGIVCFLYIAVSFFWLDPGPHIIDTSAFAWPTAVQGNKRKYEMVSQDRLPHFSTPAIVNRHGNAIWTVSIPPNSHFPLATEEYVDICAKCREVASRVDELRRKGLGIGSFGSFGGFSSIPGLGGSSKTGKQKSLSAKHFVDVHEAELAGYLAGSVSIATLMNQQDEGNDLVGQPKGGMLDRPVCARSLTFVLSSSDAGLGQSLMFLWMSFALAQNEDRPFFIDDTRWAYGDYTNIFQPPPIPDCRPPLRHEMLPCPRQARHLIVTAETASDVFAIEDDDTQSAAKTAHFFDLARVGYEALCKLNTDDSKHVVERVKQFKDKTVNKQAEAAGTGAANRGTIVGIHVRRGDRHPLEFQYRESYMPLNLYAERAHEVLETRNNKRTAAGQLARSHSLMVVASDDPMVYDASEFAGATRAQDFIKLAGKAATVNQEKNRDASYMHKFVDETLGWEGGFFSAMFWSLGRPAISAKSSSSAGETAVQEPPSPETLGVRSLIGRAYMMDLVVLAGASDTIVCAASATGCRLLAVMMGRDAAQSRGQWINIDGNYGWWAADF
ncbi:hypothetical protein CMQ_5842 [Grosmannia clavigera kw1407]|uniref:Uncharacterized protein n=1 Tax=Grosmannia clavigera (strain kw1407 / UAMH 11150) TaxID=655863 RepID=F0XIH2_GROCL|nr:uncharacterized protein CMQ_5842 [Grosmannia clavigera kw1407]EFX02481.1 hypothetical protein CMQ_5842 [Grosmannia clavigera kw1407]